MSDLRLVADVEHALARHLLHVHEIIELERVEVGDRVLIATSGHLGPGAPDTRAKVVAIIGLEHPLLRLQLPDGRVLEHVCGPVLWRLTNDDRSTAG
jgi:hypothetical protein